MTAVEEDPPQFMGFKGTCGVYLSMERSEIIEALGKIVGLLKGHADISTGF